MAAAADLPEAAELAQENVSDLFAASSNLVTPFTSWANAIATTLTDPSNVEQRRVLNWIPRIRELVASIPSAQANQNQVDAGALGVLLYRTCLAAAEASLSGAQDVALLASYNLLFA